VEMETATEVQAHLNALHEAVWELAAIVIALRDAGATDAAQGRSAARVLVEWGLMVSSPDGPQPGTGLSQVMGGDPTGVASQASTGILQSAAVLSGSKG